VVFGQIQALTTEALEQASASPHYANAQITALAAQVKARRKADAG